MAVMVDEAVLGGFDALPPGLALAAALHEVDPSALPGEEAAAWMRAAFRARNHQDWMLLRAVREACSARSGTTVRVQLDEFTPKIAAASLGWTTTMAASRLHLAVGVLERMPALGEAMRRGTLEAAEASAFVTGLEGLSDEQARRVVDTVLPDTPEMGLSELRARILEAAYAVDRVWGAARLAAATARARVSAETAPSGAVDLCGRDLDPNLAQDAKLRLRALALAIRARLRACGHQRALGFIEARVFIRLMDGTQAGAADDDAVIEAITTELATLAQGGSASDDDERGADGGGTESPDDRDDDGGDGGGGRQGPVGPRPRPDAGGPAPAAPDEVAPDEAAPEPEVGGSPDDSITDGPTSGPRERSVAFPPGIGLRLPLSTLLGLDDAAGFLPGIGPVPADVARAAARTRGAAAWQVLVHDDHGHLQHLLTLRAPPDAIHDPRFHRQTVQVTAPAGLVHALDPAGLDPTSDTGPDPLRGAGPALLDAAMTTWLTKLVTALGRSMAAAPDDHPASTTCERDRRFPSTRLADYVRARDQTCIALTCTRPAEACDVDHTLAWVHRGRTQADGLDVLCRHDHRAKHEGGWTYEQPEPGRFLITDPTGTRHLVESRVVRPLPAARRPEHGPGDWSDPGARTAREDWAPRRTRDGRITRAAKATAEHLARRTRRLEGEPPSRYDHDPDF
ncbi:HNH endonuclease signature motif containing protein [Actinomycetospora sp.]|uniref:HNH endonuclease signature motif containing protein n=1 Tax=Actinomycetospora sp. TaxID=1872135 RepID=UPI002F3E3AB2